MSQQIKKQHTTTQWSGGETTELYIFPEGSNYKNGDYQFRLSTATVEIEESTFTPLPGVDRTLIVLEGEMQLDHKNHHSALLKPLNVDVFKGDWTTRSKGRCVDFNLMCKEGTKGTVKGYSLDQNTELKLNLDGQMNFIYLYKGLIEINETELNAGELFVSDALYLLNISTKEDSTYIVVNIYQLDN